MFVYAVADLVCLPTDKEIISLKFKLQVSFNSKRLNNKKIQKNAFQISYKLICMLMSQIIIWPLHKTWLSTWWQNSCWQSQRSDVSCSWLPGLHTSQERFCPTPLCRSSPSHLGLPSQIFYGIKVWTLARPLQDLNVLLSWATPLLPWPCVLGHCHAGIVIHDPFSMPWPWRYMAHSIVPLMRCSFPVPLAEPPPPPPPLKA